MLQKMYFISGATSQCGSESDASAFWHHRMLLYAFYVAGWCGSSLLGSLCRRTVQLQADALSCSDEQLMVTAFVYQQKNEDWICFTCG